MASSLERFGFVFLDQGHIDLAIDRFTRALAEYRAAGEQRSIGLALVSLGRALTTADRPAEATGFLLQATEVLGTLPVPDPYNTARALIALGRAETKTDQPDTALPRLESALTAMRSVNSPLGEADALWSLAELHQQSGRLDDARVCYERTAVLLTELGNPGAPRVLEQLRTLGSSPAD
jgi:tetratricopeptide (TPR) repeat protein